MKCFFLLFPFFFINLCASCPCRSLKRKQLGFCLLSMFLLSSSTVSVMVEAESSSLKVDSCKPAERLLILSCFKFFYIFDNIFLNLLFSNNRHLVVTASVGLGAPVGPFSAAEWRLVSLREGNNWQSNLPLCVCGCLRFPFFCEQNKSICFWKTTIIQSF